MTSFQQFVLRSKMRYDFEDQFQVRYVHPDGEAFDTWVSGEEALSRIRSARAEKRLRSLSELDLDALRELKEELPQVGKEMAWKTGRDRLAEGVEETLGSGIISDSLADAVRGYDDDSTDIPWRRLLEDESFKAVVLELAWIQLEGSLPDEQSSMEHDDWV